MLEEPQGNHARRSLKSDGDSLRISTKKKEEGMKRKATYRLMVTRREMLYVHDEFDHSLMLVEMEGEPTEYQVGVAGEFVSRRSVTFHDRVRGHGPMKGYAITNFREGAICSSFEGDRDASTKLTKGTWKIYKGMGKLSAIKGGGTFITKPGERDREYLLEIEGDYEL
jgi:hypothetical protein